MLESFISEFAQPALIRTRTSTFNRSYDNQLLGFNKFEKDAPIADSPSEAFQAAQCLYIAVERVGAHLGECGINGVAVFGGEAVELPLCPTTDDEAPFHAVVVEG